MAGVHEDDLVEGEGEEHVQEQDLVRPRQAAAGRPAAECRRGSTPGAAGAPGTPGAQRSPWGTHTWKLEGLAGWTKVAGWLRTPCPGPGPSAVDTPRPEGESNGGRGVVAGANRRLGQIVRCFSVCRRSHFGHLYVTSCGRREKTGKCNGSSCYWYEILNAATLSASLFRISKHRMVTE